MKREECYDSYIDKYTFDIIARRLGEGATAVLTAELVDEIRVDAFLSMSEAVKAIGPKKGLFEEAVELEYRVWFN